MKARKGWTRDRNWMIMLLTSGGGNLQTNLEIYVFKKLVLK